MNNHPAMTYTQAKAFNAAEGEWSKAGNAAFAILAAVKEFKNDANWLRGADGARTSAAITTRWYWLQAWLKVVRKPGDEYSPAMMKTIEEKLQQEARHVDEVNVDFDDRDEDRVQLVYSIEQYAEVIIEALKQEMHCDQDGDEVEARAFDDNR